MSWNWCGKLLWAALRYGWFDELVPVDLRTLIERVSLLDSMCLPFGMLDVVDLGGREWMASLQEPKNQWCEGHQLVNLESRNGSPSVVHFENFYCLWMYWECAVSTADGNLLALYPLQPVSSNILLRTWRMLTWANGCLRLVPR